jgi:tetratricopeptide (TPR) repeat protein
MSPINLAIALPLIMQTASVEPQPSAEEAAEKEPIIVSGSHEDDERSLQTGSRIPRKPVFGEFDLNIRSSTGVRGLGPGSGMEPFNLQNPVMRSTIATCKSDNDAIGERASCLLLSARSSAKKGETERAADLYRYLVSSDDFSSQERVAGGESLYALGEAVSDPVMKEEALLRLIKSEALPVERAQLARRALVSFALNRGDTPVAINRLEATVSADQDDAQSLANLAILLREQGSGEAAVERMHQAIATKQRLGQNVPDSWTAFVG